MSTSPVPEGSAAPAAKPVPPKTDTDQAVPHRGARWQNYITPVLVVLLALAVLITITRNWNAWEGGKVEQVTDDAYVRGDLTPLSTKVAGIVRAVDVADYQQVHKGDLLVELQDDDYQAQVDQAKAAVEAARAGIEENLRQRQLQDTRIAKALAGIDQAKAQIAAAEAGKDAVQAELIRARSERKRQEGLYQTHSTTEQNLEAAVAGEGNLSAQLASRDADLNQAQTMLRSSELAAEAERRSKVVLESQARNFRPTCTPSRPALLQSGESWLHQNLRSRRRHGGRTASSAWATRLPRHPGHLLCCSHQVGRSELSRNPVDQREDWGHCRTTY
jgi:hypothetical protein